MVQLKAKKKKNVETQLLYKGLDGRQQQKVQIPVLK